MEEQVVASMTSFEDRLWAELTSEHATELAQGPPPQRRKPTRSIPVVFAAFVLAGVILASIATLMTSSSAPAFAVTQNSDGTVTVTIKELIGIHEANTQLEALSVHVRAAGIEASCTTDMSNFHTVPFPPQIVASIFSIGKSATTPITITPSVIPAGDTLLLEARQVAPELIAINLKLFQGPVPSCIPATAASEPDTD
jgi:hypothetical protein